MEPDLDGFREASDRFRQQVGRSLVYLTPVTETWPEGTAIDPENGRPFDPTIQPLASGFASAAVNTLVVKPGATSRVAEVVEAAIGRIETGEAVLIVARDDWENHSLDRATQVAISDEEWMLLQSDFDGVGGELDDRVLIHVRQRNQRSP